MADEDFQTFLERRRAETAMRRQRWLTGLAIGGLVVACLALALSNVILAERLAATRAASVPAAVTAVADTAAADHDSPSALPRPELPEAPAPPPPAATTMVEEPVAPGLPLMVPRPSAVQPRPKPAPPRPIATRTDPAGVTAEWMLRQYGRPEAEERAATAAGFYAADDPAGAHWRAVLSHIQGR